jgi:hypothetical protein|tara:strand:- start:595 stop:1005 length:411 start_codon:yes stop_codon:yes gene_type:complete
MAFKKQKKNAIAVTADTNEEYVTWLSLVPAKERSRMADMVKNHSLSSFGDLADLTKKITAEVLAGTLSPSVASTILDFIQTLFTCVGAASAESSRVGGGSAELSALETLAESSQQIQDTVIDFATVDVAPSIFNKN